MDSFNITTLQGLLTFAAYFIPILLALWVSNVQLMAQVKVQKDHLKAQLLSASKPAVLLSVEDALVVVDEAVNEHYAGRSGNRQKYHKGKEVLYFKVEAALWEVTLKTESFMPYLREVDEDLACSLILLKDLRKRMFSLGWSTSEFRIEEGSILEEISQELQEFRGIVNRSGGL